MKNSNFVFVLFFLVILFSCKKDFDFDEESLIDQPFVKHFYAEGSLYDHGHEKEVEFELDNIEIELEQFGEENEILYVGSASAVGEENSKKYIISAIGINSKAIRSIPSPPHDDYYMNLMRNFISVKIISNRPGSESDRKFTRDELLEMFEVGKSYSYGSAPMEVEVGFQKPPVDSLPSSSILGYIGSTFEVPNDNSVFEILKIEDFEESEVQNPVSGLKVRVRINADVKYFGFPIIALQDVEATFLFEYE